MTIENTNVIDIIGTDNKTGNIILTISDHLDWKDSKYHLSILQEKINSYLRFIESGEIYSNYPNAKENNLVIEIVGKFDLSLEGQLFINQAKEVVKNAGIELRFSKLYY